MVDIRGYSQVHGILFGLGVSQHRWKTLGNSHTQCDSKFWNLSHDNTRSLVNFTLIQL